METEKNEQRDRVFFKLFLKSATSEVTDEEMAYFRDNPEEIDEITAPVAVHKLFLWAGALLGTLFVGVAKVIKFSQFAMFSEGVSEFVIDMVFETGVALIGAAVTAYILGILLNQQQDNANGDRNWPEIGGPAQDSPSWRSRRCSVAAGKLAVMLKNDNYLYHETIS